MIGNWLAWLFVQVDEVFDKYVLVDINHTRTNSGQNLPNNLEMSKLMSIDGTLHPLFTFTLMGNKLLSDSIPGPLPRFGKDHQASVRPHITTNSFLLPKKTKSTFPPFLNNVHLLEGKINSHFVFHHLFYFFEEFPWHSEELIVIIRIIVLIFVLHLVPNALPVPLHEKGWFLKKMENAGNGREVIYPFLDCMEKYEWEPV